MHVVIILSFNPYGVMIINLSEMDSDLELSDRQYDFIWLIIKCSFFFVLVQIHVSVLLIFGLSITNQKIHQGMSCAWSAFVFLLCVWSTGPMKQGHFLEFLVKYISLEENFCVIVTKWSNTEVVSKLLHLSSLHAYMKSNSAVCLWLQVLCLHKVHNSAKWSRIWYVCWVYIGLRTMTV